MCDPHSVCAKQTIVKKNREFVDETIKLSLRNAGPASQHQLPIIATGASHRYSSYEPHKRSSYVAVINRRMCKSYSQESSVDLPALRFHFPLFFPLLVNVHLSSGIE